MLEIEGDLFKQRCSAICITTNGDIRSDGVRGIMGAGIAARCRDKFKSVEYTQASMLKLLGNVPSVLINDINAGWHEYCVVSFPTKHTWKRKSDIDLIRKSCSHLVVLADWYGWNTVCLPRPGCSNGGLDWMTAVKPVLEEVLDDRFIVVTLLT